MKKFLGLFILLGTALFYLSCTIGLGKAVDTVAPEISITSPAVDSVIRDAFAFKGTWSDDGEITKVALTLTSTSSEGGTSLVYEGTFDSSEDGTGTWEVKLDPLNESKPIPDGTYEATIAVTDGGEHTTKQSRSLVIDNTAPIIVLQRPSSKAGESPDAYGQTFTLEGQAADDNDVSLIEVNIYGDEDCSTFLHQVKLTNVPPTISLDVAKFVEDAENDYSKIYGSSKKDGAKNFYVSIVAYDSAQRYPVEGNQEASDTNGNSTNYYYLYEDISSTVLSDHKITDVYHMINGTYKGSEGERAAETISSVKKVLSENLISVGSFSLNPANNPHFTVSGRDALLLDGKDFASSANNLSSGSDLVVDVSTGLDSIPLKSDTLKPYIINCDENGVVSGSKIYFEEFQKTKSGSSYKIVFNVVKSADILIGKNYLVGIEGTDEKGNEVVASGKAYGFHFSPSGVSPKLTDIASYINGNKSASENNLYVAAKNPADKTKSSIIKIVGNVQSDDPDVVVVFKIDGNELKDIPLTKVETEKFSFEKEIDTIGFENANKSGQHEIEIVASNSATTPTTVSKIVMFDATCPDITLDESVTTVAKKYTTEAGTDDGKSYLNGTVDIKIQISDDAEGTGIETSAQNKPYFEIVDANGQIQSVKLAGESAIGTKHYIEKPAAQVVSVDTTLLAEGKTVFRIHGWDKAGNYSTKDFEYYVDQSTDKPFIATSDPESLGFAACDTKEKLEAIKNGSDLKKKNIIEKNTVMDMLLSDDDGLSKYVFKVGKVTDGSDIVMEVPDGHYDDENNKSAGKAISGKSKTVGYTPMVTGYYKCSIVAYDVNGKESLERSFYILVTGYAPVVTVSKNREIITKATANIAADAKTNILNTINIDSADGPFIIKRVEKKSETENIETVLVTDTSNLEYTDTFVPAAGVCENKVTYVVIDSNGHEGERLVTYNVDSTRPVVTITNDDVPSVSATENSKFTFKAKVEDTAPAGSGETSSNVSKVIYKFGINGTEYTNNAAELNQSINFADTFDSEGPKTIYVRAIDDVGNISEWASKDFVYDKSSPSLAITSYKQDGTSPTSLTGSNNTVSASKKFTLSGTAQDGYGVKKVEIWESKDGADFATDANWTFEPVSPATTLGTNYVWSKDNLPSTGVETGTFKYKVVVTDLVGKKSEEDYVTVKIDVDAPTIKINAPIADRILSGTSTVLSGDVKDKGSAGVGAYYYAITDNSVAPVPSITDSVWTKVEFITTAEAEDTWEISKYVGTGLTPSSNPEANTIYEGEWYIHVFAEDRAGNIPTTAVSRHFYVDQAAPVISDVKQTTQSGSDLVENGTFYYNATESDFVISGKILESNGLSEFTAKVDNGTAQAIAQPTASTSAEEWSYTVTGVSADTEKTIKIYAKDKASRDVSKTYKIFKDTLDPNVQITNPDADVSGSDALTGSVDSNGVRKYIFRGTVNDAGSGIPENKYKYKFTQTPFADKDAVIADLSTWEDYTGQSFSSTKDIIEGTAGSAGKLHEGRWYLYIYAKDGVGHDVFEKREFWIDLSNPKVTVKIGDSSVDKNTDYTDSNVIATKEKNIKVYFGASDTHGLDKSYGITDPENSTSKLGISVSVTKSDGTSVTPDVNKDTNGYYITLPSNPADETYSYVITAKDLAGKTTTLTRSVRLDTTGPVIDTTTPVFTLGVSAWQKSKNVTVTGTAKDASVVKNVYYKLSATKPATTDMSIWTTDSSIGTANWQIDFTGEESDSNKLWITAKDELGNISDPVLRTIKIDSVVPVLEETNIGLTGKKITASDANDSNAKLKLSGKFKDVTSGIKTITIEDSLGSFTAIEISETSDTTPKAFSAVDKNTDASWKKDIAISSLADGEHIITITGEDVAGNKTTVQRSVVVDTKAPSAGDVVVAATNKSSYTGESGTQVWYTSNSNVITVANIVDVPKVTGGYASNIASVDYSTNASDENPIWIGMTKSSPATTYTANVNCSNQGENVISVRIKDAVGNETVKSTTIYIDTEKPEIPTAYTVTYNGTEYKTNNGLFTEQLIINGRNDVVLTLNPSDDGSGIDKISKGTSNTGTASSGVYTLTISPTNIATGGINITIKDKVGLSTIWNPFTVLKDTAAPSVKITDPKDADEATGIQVNGVISLTGTAKDSGGSDIKQIDVCYATSDAANSWTHLKTLSSETAGVDLNNWSIANVDTTSAFGSLSDGTKVYICAIVTDNAGNRNTDTVSDSTVTDNTKLDGEDGTSGNLIPNKKPSDIDSSNIKEIIVNQDTDRPKIAFTNVSLKDMTSSSYAYLNNTNTLYGIASDDDGISEMYYNKRVELSSQPSDWATVDYYTDAGCTTKATTYAAGTYYKKEQLSVSGSGSFSISDIPEGANEIHFWVKDAAGGIFPSANKGAPKLTGNESSPAVKTVVYLRVNTVGPEISDLQFQRYDATTRAYEKDSDGKDIVKTYAQLNSSYKFGGTKYTKVKVIAKVTDANGIKSVKIGNVTGAAVSGKTGYYAIEVPLSSITTSGPASFTITTEDNIPDQGGKKVSMTSNQNFDITIDRTAPTMKISSHTPGATIRSTFTLKGSIDDASATMKYVITDSATLANNYDWSSSNTAVKSYSGDAIVSWDITFDGDTLNQNEMHDKDQKSYFVDLYGTAAKSGTTNGIVKNSTTGTILEKSSATDTEGNPDKKYTTKKPFYFHFLLTDDLGNSDVDNTFNLMVDPQGDVPVVEMTNPVIESYAYYDSSASDKFAQQTPENYKKGVLPTGVTKENYRGAYGTASGRINVAGYAEDDKAIAGLYVQIDPTYDPSVGFKWVGATDTLPNGKTLGLAEYGYTIKTIQHNGEDVKINNQPVTAIYIGDNTSWSIKLNAKNEFNGVGDANNTIAIKLFAIDTDGNLLAPGDTDIFIITIDSGAPKIGEHVDFALWQYAWVNASTGVTLYTNTDTPTSTSKAYTDVLCTTGEAALTVGDGKITVGGNDYTKAFVNKPYKDSDFWLQGKWWLVGSVEDESGISSIKVTDNRFTDKEIDAKYKEQKTYSCTASGKYDYLVRYPVDLTGRYGKATYTLSVKDNQDKDNSATFAINFDNNPPSLKGTSDASFNISESVVNTDGFYTIGSAVEEADGESGFARAVVYFKRTATGYENVYDVFLPKSGAAGVATSPIEYSDLHYEDGLYWQEATAGTITAVSGSTNSTIAVTTTDNVHKGGIVKFGGNIYTIKDKSASSITLDGTPSSALEGAKIYFAIGAVIDRTGTEGAANGATKITSGEGKGYWNNISGDDDYMVEKVNIQGTKAIWEGNINTKNIPDGPIEIHYVVYDKAGNSSHGIVGSDLSAYTDIIAANKLQKADVFVRNNAPMIASVTVATTFTGGDEPEYEETWFVSEKTRKIGGKEVKKSIGVSSNVTVANGSKGFMTIKDKSWVKPEIVGGNGALKYTYKISNNAGTKLDESSSAISLNVSGTIEGGEEFLNSKDSNDATYVSGQTLTLPITTEMLDKITSNSTLDAPTSFLFTIMDSTEGTTSGLAAIADVKLAVNYRDISAPKTVILPFEWYGTGTTELTGRDADGNYVVHCNYPNNNLYEGSLENGHIELSRDLPSSFNGSTGINDTDPKVSGKISIRGYSYDDIRLAKIWIKMSNTAETNGISFGTGLTVNGNDGYVQAATYAIPAGKTEKEWTGTDKFASDGWKFTVFAADEKDVYKALPVATATDYSKTHNYNLGAYYGSYFNQSGHKVYWQLDLNTEKLTSVAGTDIVLSVITEAEKGTGDNKYSSTSPETTAGDPNKNTPSYQMDVVPYITKVYTKLGGMKVSNWSVNGRTALGHYTVAADETVYIYGFNLGNETTKPNFGNVQLDAPASGATLNNAYPSGNAEESVSGVDYSNFNIVKFLISNLTTSGNFALSVNNVTSLNNSNKDYASGANKTVTSTSKLSDKETYAYNLQPNGDNNNILTDDVYFDVWEVRTAAKPNSGAASDVVMKINPKDNRVGFAFVNGQMNFAMPNKNTSYTDWQQSYETYHSVGLAYDSNGDSFAVAAGGDSNSHQADLFNFLSSKMGRGTYNNKAGSNNGTNALRLESIAQKTGTTINTTGGAFDVVPDRIQSPSLATSRREETNTTHVYLAYWDKINDEIRFRVGKFADNTTAKPTWGTIKDYFTDNELGGSGKTNTSVDANYGYYYDGGCQILATTTGTNKTGTNAGNNTAVLGNAGPYVSIGVVRNNTENKDVVVIVWFDQVNKKLCYAYNTSPTTVRTGINMTGWTKGTDILAAGEGGEYCQLAVDANGGIHIAAYTGLNNKGDLKYAYLSSYDDTTPEVCTVDSNGIVGDNITIDVAKVGDNYVPYIGYYTMSQAMPKYAYKVSADVRDGMNKSDEAFNGNWEVTYIPTSSAVPQARINVGVFKNASGERAYSTINKLVNGTIGNNNAGAGGGDCYGNGTDYPILGYKIDVSGTESWVETAQMK